MVSGFFFFFLFPTVLNRIKIRLKNTVIRLEYSPNGDDRGIAIIMKIDKLEYKNEAGGDPPDKPANAPDVDDDDDNGPKTYLIPVYSTHQLLIENVTFYMEEFRIYKPNMNDGTSQMKDSVPVAEQFYSTISELPEIQSVSINQDKSCDEASSYSDDDNETTISDICDINRSESLQIACFHGKIDIKITVKVRDQLNQFFSIVQWNYKYFIYFIHYRDSFSKRSHFKAQKCNWKFN